MGCTPSSSSSDVVVSEETRRKVQDLLHVEWYKQFLPKHEKKIEILHFNDVYNLEGKQADKTPLNDDWEVLGSASRFKTAFDVYDSKNKLVVFSGDLFFPSILSTHFEGEQMIFPFETLNVDINCLGNHELDHGMDTAIHLMSQTSSPWIMTNLLEKDTGNPIANCKPYHIIEKNGVKFGFLGFADAAWTDCMCPDIEVDKMKYIDFNESLKEWSKKLKEEHKCDYVVAINHVRLPDDEKMGAANNSDVVDMIFGGHDHCYARILNQETNVFIQKSGTDFECFTNLTVLEGVEEADFKAFNEEFAEGAKKIESGTKKIKPSEDIESFYSAVTKRMYISERVNITRSFEPHPAILEHTAKYADKLGERLNQDCGFCTVELDCRFSRVRTEETNLGNMMADLMRSDLLTDLALSNGGCLRANQIFPEGALQLRFMDLVMPMQDTVERIRMSGKLFIEAIENGISEYPKYEGRFPVFSGLKMQFDPEREPGSRILMESIKNLDDTPFDLEKSYTVATKSFMKLGKDGYTMMLDPSIEDLPPVRGEDDPTIQEIYIKFFRRFMLPDSEIAKFTPESKKLFEHRLKLLNTSQDNRDAGTGAVKFSPMVDGRLVNIRDPVKHED